jgi:hypothetical protein
MPLPLLLALAVLLTAAPAARADVRGAVAGVRDPAAGVVELTVLASEDDSVGLRSAGATLGGERLAAAPFADPACLPDVTDPAGCPASGSVTLLVDTTEAPDGLRRLEVAVEDGAGRVTRLVDRPIRVANAPLLWQSTVTLTLGSGTPRAGVPPAGGSGSVPTVPGTRAGCAQPRLTMQLVQRPLRFRRGIPVLVRGRRHRLAGRLTCRAGGRRGPAPRGTAVEVRHRVRGRTVARPVIRVRRDGRLSAWIRPAGPQTVVFRIRAADGSIVRVRIPIRVARHRA